VIPRRALVTALAMSIAAFVGCKQKSSEATEPNAPATRIVSLSPAASVIVRDLGRERDIVGRHAFDYVVSQKLPVCGDQAGIDYESLLAARPTHVLAEWGAKRLPARLGELAAERGWKVVNLEFLTLDDVRRSARDVAAALNAETTEQAASLNTRLALLGVGSDIDTDRTVLLLVSTSPVGALGPGTLHQQLVRAIGAAPVPRDGPGYTELTHEDLKALDPWAIVVLIPRPPRDATHVEAVNNTDDPFAPLRPLGLRAVSEDRAVVIDDPLCLIPSTSILSLAQRLETLVERWSIAMPEPTSGT